MVNPRMMRDMPFADWLGPRRPPRNGHSPASSHHMGTRRPSETEMCAVLCKPIRVLSSPDEQKAAYDTRPACDGDASRHSLTPCGHCLVRSSPRGLATERASYSNVLGYAHLSAPLASVSNHYGPTKGARSVQIAGLRVEACIPVVHISCMPHRPRLLQAPLASRWSRITSPPGPPTALWTESAEESYLGAHS